MENSITNAYKNKEYGWYIAYIVIIVVSLKIAGLIGLIASVLAVSGLYKVAKNSALSKTKKALLSITYIVCGIVGILVAVTLFKQILQRSTNLNFASEPATKEILNAKSYEPARNVPKAVEQKTNNSTEYLNEVNNFKINLPDGWVINKNAQNNIIAEFDDPTPNQLGAITIGSDHNMKSSLKEYSAGIMQGTIEEGANNVQVIKQEEIILNGNPAYSVEFNYDYKISNETYKMHALSVALINKETGYAILCVTQNETWGLYSQSFWKSLSSFTFLK